MTWFAVDDAFHGHPKLASIRDPRTFAEAISLWVLAGSWCAYHLTDGAVPIGQLRRLVPFSPTKGASALVSVGLWVETVEGYAFRDWHDYQPTREEVEAKRAGGASRTRKWRRNRDAKRDASPTHHATVTETVTNGVTDASVTLTRTPIVLSSESTTRAPARGPGAAAMMRSLTPAPDGAERVTALASAARQAIGGAPFRPASHQDRDAVSRLAEWACSITDGWATLERALRGFYATKGAAASLRWFADEDPGRWATSAPVAAAMPTPETDRDAAYRAEDDRLKAREVMLRGSGDNDGAEMVSRERRRLAESHRMGRVAS